MRLLGNISLIKHVVENLLAAFRIVVRMCNRIVITWTLGNRSDDRAFRKSQLRHILVKVPLGSSLYPECILAKVDGIQIVFHDFAF